MRVLMLRRSDMGEGGEATQIRELGTRLRRLGVDVSSAVDLEPDLRGVDLVHVFGLTQPAEALVQVSHARRHAIPVILSPAYQRFGDYNRRGRYGLAALVYRILPSESLAEVPKQLVRAARAPSAKWALVRVALVPYREQQRRLLTSVQMVLPNSRAEAQAIAEDLGAAFPFRVVRYGASSRFACAHPDNFVAHYGLRDFVLSVGFISSLKNQLRLIEALDGTGLKLVIIGSEVPTHRAYARAVRRAASRHPWVTLLGPMPHETLASAYAAARVIALPSWFETCGMVGLEGALAGCRVVMTNRGYSHEYFGDTAVYCDPGDVTSIRDAVLEAYERPIPETFRERILQELSWDSSAAETLAAYETAVAGRGDTGTVRSGAGSAGSRFNGCSQL